MVLPRTSVSSAAMTSTPMPTGTEATMVPRGAKFARLLSSMVLLRTRHRRPSRTGRFGRLNTSTPAVLSHARFSYTSESVVFSISMPATLPCTRLRRTITLRDWPT